MLGPVEGQFKLKTAFYHGIGSEIGVMFLQIKLSSLVLQERVDGGLENKFNGYVAER